MKKNYFSLFALLLTAFAFFAGMSFFGDDFEDTCGIKTASFASDLFKHSPSQLAHADTLGGKDSTATALKPAPFDTTKKNILFIGDSMLERLSPRIAAYAEENGHQMNTVIWYGSSTEVWATSGRVKEKVAQYKPDYILISLGGNELFINDIIARRTKYVKQIVAEFGNIPYVWIGPPNWKPDTGINDMIRSVVPEGSFYLSYTPDQHYDRASDGAHPTAASAAKWADRICRWIMEKSNNPIVLKMPKKDRGHCHTEMFSMTDDEAKPKPKAEAKPQPQPKPKQEVAEQPAAAQPEVSPANTDAP
ncbi:MAG: SGNH/GDSL hydrolase family protein [Bacteroidales bacterium]|nr:SGNH/GDSL hydrolase family protein [Bacteroidales bacterium]